MTNGNDYSGAIESAKQLKKLLGKAYRFYVGEQIPKDPHEILALAEKVRKDEELRGKADEAREYIKKTWKERKRRERMERRAKLKRLFGKKS